MIIEIRKVETRAKANYIRSLQYRKLIPVYINAQGYVCYDPADLKAYQSSVKVGRPVKNK